LNNQNVSALAPLAQLEASVAKLKAAFLPNAAKASYTDEELVAAKALVVFTHAELEDYLEIACRAKANRALAHLQNTGTVSLTAFSLLSYCGEAQPRITEIAKYKEAQTKLASEFAVFAPPATRSLLNSLKKAVGVFAEICRKNNGVKEANLLPMLLPLGLNPLSIDPLWIGELNGFGVDRGAQAHRGLESVEQIEDPFLATARMTKILEGAPGGAPPPESKIAIFSLRSLDAWLLQQ
jgi:hypothetical protein